PITSALVVKSCLVPVRSNLDRQLLRPVEGSLQLLRECGLHDTATHADHRPIVDEDVDSFDAEQPGDLFEQVAYATVVGPRYTRRATVHVPLLRPRFLK